MGLSVASFFGDVKRGDLAAVKRALGRQPAVLHARAADGRTPLHAAAEVGNHLVLRTLLQLGADYAAADAAGELPLMLAARHVRAPRARARPACGAAATAPQPRQGARAAGARAARYPNRAARARARAPARRATWRSRASCSPTRAAARASRRWPRTAARRCTSPRPRARRASCSWRWTPARAPTRGTGCVRARVAAGSGSALGAAS